MSPSTKRSWPQVNQKQIALEAGVSQATVSLVLAGQKVNSEATRIKVLAAAERLRYRPNLLVQGIQTGKTGVVGVMAPPFDFYWSEILYGIHDVLTSAKHVPMIVWTVHGGPGPRRRNADGDELAQVHLLLDRRIDAVILWPPFASVFKDHIDEFSSRDIPIITIDHELPEEFGADSIATDEISGGRHVAEYLLGLGHRRLGHLAGPVDATWSSRRRAAFEETVKAVPGATCTTIEVNLHVPQQGIEEARKLLGSKDRPTAIFAATDPIARTVYHVAAELGLSVPRDISVVGYVDDDFAVDLEPPLTTVRQFGYEIGRRAAEMALGRSLGTLKEPKPIRCYEAAELIVRGSAAPPPQI